MPERARETWTYRSVGKTVVFENGIVVSSASRGQP